MLKKSIEEMILKVFDKKELPSHLILERLETQGVVLTYDTLSKYLKKMTEKNKLIRERKGKPWGYFYKKNK